jgi:phage repressor protein C with HTH and peptisase S24 domain
MAGVLDAGNPAHVLADLVPSAGLAEAPAPYRAAGRDELEKGFVLVPRYDIQAAAGAGSFADVEEVADWLAFKEEWVRRVLRVHPAKLVLVEATGDSMEPAVRSGDLLLLDTGVNRVLDDTIYVLVKDGAVVVKRVQKFMGGAVIIKSDNPAYVEETIPPHDVADLRIAGRVRWIGRLI